MRAAGAKISMASASVDDVISVAAAQLGYPTIKDEQREAMKEFLNGRDVFVALPTGFGKSLCYAVLLLAFNSLLGRPSNSSIVICVSPLVSLIIM